MAKGINIKFPFQDTQTGGIFKVNKITENALKDNLISLLTTRRGQRVMRSELYSPIYDYIMEPIDNNLKRQLSLEIENKVDEFLPEVNIKEILITEIEEENLVNIKLIFSTDFSYGSTDTINLTIPREGTDFSQEQDDNIN
jgi:phage baseplate assembly protein W